MYKEEFCKFLPKKYSYLRSLRFFENGNFAACVTRGPEAEIADFLELNSYKNIPDQLKRVRFQKSKKSAKSLHMSKKY